jgi:hypothetical protein
MLQAWRSRIRLPMRSLNFFLFLLILRAALWDGVDSASNRNEYQDSFGGIKGGRRVRLTTLLSSVSRLSRKCGTFDVSQPYRPLRSRIALLFTDSKAVTVCVELSDRQFMAYNVGFNRIVLCPVSYHGTQLLFIQRTVSMCHFHSSFSVFIAGIINVKMKWTKTWNSFYMFVNIHMQK